MIRNLDQETLTSHSANFVVIGGGTVGLLIAQKIANLELGKVVVLELGDEKVSFASERLPKVVFPKDRYAGAADGRFVGLGGTSARWGGAMIPFLPEDFEGEFRNLVMKANLYVSEIEEIFSLPQGPYEVQDSLQLPNYVTRLAKWPKFSRRNVAQLFEEDMKSHPNLIIYKNAKVTRFNWKNSKIISVEVENCKVEKYLFESEKFIIAAGAIESTRMLLELEDEYRTSQISNSKSTTGSFFSDHLSVKIANLSATDRTRLNMLAGYRFAPGGSMSNIRFELDPNSRIRESLPPHFIHISFNVNSPGALEILREILRIFQEGGIPPVGLFLKLLKFLPWLLRASWWRYFRKRLLYPDNVDIEMHLVIQQEPHSENRIALSSQSDALVGNQALKISWEVTPRDMSNALRVFKHLKVAWNESECINYADALFLDEEQILSTLSQGGGIYHPSGSTRISFKCSEGSVDSNLKVNGLDNLFLVSTSVLNSGGAANPTMTQMMLALRLVDYLAKV